MSLTWVVGAGGLLGSHVVQRVRAPDALWSLAGRIHWDGPGCRASIVLGRGALLRGCRRPALANSLVQGKGRVGSTISDLESEVHVYDYFLARVSDLSRRLGRHTPGSFFYSSSAGGVFAGSSSSPFHEGSPAQAPRGLRTCETQHGAAHARIQSGNDIALPGR